MDEDDTVTLTEVKEEPSQTEGARDFLDDKIILRIVGPHQTDMNFRIKASTSIDKLKKTYSERTRVPLATLQLVFRGRPIANDDTPQHLKMKDEDKIVAVEEYPAYRRVCLALEKLGRHSHHFKSFIQNEMTDDLVESCIGEEVAALDKLFVKLADRLQFTREFKQISQNYQEDGRLKQELFPFTPFPSLMPPGPFLPITNGKVNNDPGQMVLGLKKSDKEEDPNGRRGPRKNCYTLHEIKGIVKYVCEYGARHRINCIPKGMWKEAERTGKFPGRSAEGLHFKFVNSILPNVKSFDWLSLEDLRRLETLAKGRSCKGE